jgi:fimbrial chaperone protein
MLLIMAPVRATAADLQVSPVRVILDPQQSSAVMTLTNRGTTDSLLQLSVMSWTQGPGGESLTPTRDILANPGVFLLKAGEQQIARFALRVTPDVKERSYRIVLQEVPRQRVENGLATVLRLLVPVFVPPPNVRVSLEWSARPIPGGVEIRARNTGTVHVQIKAVKLGGDKITPVSTMSNIYVLPGSTGTVRVPVTGAVKAGAVLQIAAETDQQSFNAGVVVGAAEGVPAQP